MSEKYIIGIDQSTQGTKAILLDRTGGIAGKTYLPHEQIVNEQGWVSHDPEEIFRNTVQTVKMLIGQTAVDPKDVAAIGISNQRETTLAWERETGEPVGHAVVWQCARAKEIAAEADEEFAALVRERTGIPFSPYFPAAKAAWILRNHPRARELGEADGVCIGTVDAWLIWKLTGGNVFRTDFSNASRMQLFDLHTLRWNEEICAGLGIPVPALPEVTDSDGDYGATTLEGFFEEPVPIRGVLGDSHAALFGQGCIRPGMAKATYGTGSSVMMNIGPAFRRSTHGLVTSLAWGRSGRVDYVLEGNINYSGAIITWLKETGLLTDPAESGELAEQANPADTTYLVPAFSGLGAPYWNSEARAAFVGMSRTTGRAELVRAGLEAMAYQAADIAEAMGEDAGLALEELRVDGGPTANRFLMQFQSDMLRASIRVSEVEELSAVGAAVMAGIAAGVMDESILNAGRTRTVYSPRMDDETRERKISGWKEAVQSILGGERL